MFLPSDRSYMRLTEKEHETLPIDVSNFYPYFQPSSWFQILFFFFFLFYQAFSFFMFPDCTADFVVIYHDLLRYCPHRWRVQRYGCFLRAEKQVSWLHLGTPPLPRQCSCFFVLCHRGSSWLTTSATFIVILLWSCSPRIPQMQLYITQLVCWKPPKTENIFKAKPKNGAYTWK